MKRRLFIAKAILSILFLSLIPMNSYAEESQLAKAPIVVDGKPIVTKYIMRDGHILVPALFLKHTGTFVDWDNTYQSVVFHTDNKMFAVPIGKKFTDDYDPATGTWKRGTLTTEAMIYKNEVFVPLIDVVKKLNMDVRYDSAESRTHITTNIDIKMNNIDKKETNEKLVALTFDDGPEYYYTPKILDILKEKGVPATFFVMGQQVKAHPELMKRTVNEGHAIGIHTYTHPYLINEWTGKVRAEITSTQKVIEETLGIRTDLFRPPYGAITKADVAILNKFGLRNILWSVDTLDWSGASAEQILETVNQNITPGGIVLQHNFQEGRLLGGTIEALPQIIDDLHEKGYKFVTVQTLLEQ